MKQRFYELYRAGHDNAVDLVQEAEILFKGHHYARAYALALTALEEISKSQLAADVYSGFSPEQEFWNHYKNHTMKLDRIGWATEEARGYLDAPPPDGDYVKVDNPSFANRLASMYVSIDGNRIVSPSDVIDHDAAKGIIHAVNAALDSILRTEMMNGQIGTKGFMG